MSEVIQFTDRSGLAPGLLNSAQRLNDDLWQAVDKATDSGMPLEFIIGMLEVVKLSVFTSSEEVEE